MRLRRLTRKIGLGLLAAALLIVFLDLVISKDWSVRLVGRPLLAVYQNHISPAMDHDCPMHPSCSDYFGQAMDRFGLVRGVIIGLDRLIHEQSRLTTGRPVLTPAGRRILDPLAGNTDWWAAKPVKIPDENRPYELGLALLAAHKWRDASLVLVNVPLEDDRAVQAAFLAKEAIKGENLPHRNPLTMAVLSALVPGAGQLYMGLYPDAAWAAGLSLGGLVVGAGAGVAGAWVLSGGAIAVGLVGYATNIYNAANQAHYYNWKVRDDFLRTLLKTAAGLPGAG